MTALRPARVIDENGRDLTPVVTVNVPMTTAPIPPEFVAALQDDEDDDSHDGEADEP